MSLLVGFVERWGFANPRGQFRKRLANAPIANDEPVDRYFQSIDRGTLRLWKRSDRQRCGDVNFVLDDFCVGTKERPITLFRTLRRRLFHFTGLSNPFSLAQFSTNEVFPQGIF